MANREQSISCLKKLVLSLEIWRYLLQSICRSSDLFFIIKIEIQLRTKTKPGSVLNSGYRSGLRLNEPRPIDPQQRIQEYKITHLCPPERMEGEKVNRGSVSALSAGAYTATFVRDGNRVKGGWACTPHPHQQRLIFPS
jgi:hypothetical protein